MGGTIRWSCRLWILLGFRGRRGVAGDGEGGGCEMGWWIRMVDEEIDASLYVSLSASGIECFWCDVDLGTQIGSFDSRLSTVVVADEVFPNAQVWQGGVAHLSSHMSDELNRSSSCSRTQSNRQDPPRPYRPFHQAMQLISVKL